MTKAVDAVEELMTQATKERLSETAYRRARRACKTLGISGSDERRLLIFLWYPDQWISRDIPEEVTATV